MAVPPAREPPTLLGYHRILSPSAGVRVSPLCLGTMNFGDAWKHGMGECSKETTFSILDAFHEAGGNFIDTANFYQGEDSEKWVGEWVAARQNRDQLVLSTKYTFGYRLAGPELLKSNFSGNSAKSMRLSLEASLKKLQTDYIDVFYVHFWDFTTGVEELMNSLHNLVVQGKVLYLGISGTPAWLVVKCNEYARFHGLTRFSVYQGHWSAAFRDVERDILPMCESEGLAITPWGVLGRGQFREGDGYAREGRKMMGPQDETHRLVGEVLGAVAEKKQTSRTSVALAYVMHKAPYVFPVVGGRRVEHLRENIAALGLELTADEVREIEAAAPFDVGYPLSFLFEKPGPGGQKYSSDMTTRDIWQVAGSGRLEIVPKLRPIEPRQSERYYAGK